jgi:hypothetical protein
MRNSSKLNKFLACVTLLVLAFVLLAMPGHTQATAYSVAVSWTASTSPNISGYNVYRATASGGESGTTPINGTSLVAGLTYTDSNVTPGTTYYYAVTAVNSTGVQSALSAEASAAIPALPLPPSGVQAVIK